MTAICNPERPGRPTVCRALYTPTRKSATAEIPREMPMDRPRDTRPDARKKKGIRGIREPMMAATPTMSALRRTRIGPYSVHDAAAIPQVTAHLEGSLAQSL